MYQRKLNTQIPDPESNKSKLKIIIISSLGAIIIILFYFYITFGVSDDSTVSETVSTKPVSKEIISKDIDSIFGTFGIKENWIKETKLNSKSENLWFAKEVLIPQDILTVELNYELTNYLKTYSLTETVTEDPKTKNLIFNIFSKADTVKQLNGIVKLIFSDSVKRKISDVCIVLDSIDFYPLKDVQEILELNESYSVFLPLRNDKADYQSGIIEAKKDYLIEFTIGDENNIIADFKTDMKESTWKAKIKSIAMSFPDNAGVILKSSDLYEDFENKVRSEFTKNKITVYKDTVFIKFRWGENKINSLFESIISNTISGKNYLTYELNLSPAEFKEYSKKVYRIKKLGYKFYTFSALNKKINKLNQ